MYRYRYICICVYIYNRKNWNAPVEIGLKKFIANYLLVDLNNDQNPVISILSISSVCIKSTIKQRKALLYR